MSEGPRYPLEAGEFEVAVRGRTGPKRSDGTIRMDCMNNLEFYVELQLPDEYILQLADKIKNSNP